MISGHFGLNFARPMPVVRASLHLPGITSSFVALDFLLDTGATSTCLHPQDAIVRVGISPAALATPHLWPSVTSSQGIGGPAGYYSHPAVYAFRHDDGTWQQIDEEICIAQPSPTNAVLPSLLGWNLLQHFKITIDWATQRVSLE